jgi:hypothetical protein
MDGGVTTSYLIAMAAEHGIAVTARQAERWRNERLIAPNARRGLGQGVGSTWLYHEDDASRFLAAAQLVVVERCPISEAAVQLWIRGFGMEADLLRRHLQRATRTMHRLREKLAARGAEDAGLSALDALRRRPQKRSEWGMREWSEPERDGMAAFVEDIVGGYVGPGGELAPETVERSKSAMGITPDVDAALAAGGNDLGLLFRTAFPKHARLDEIAQDATDEELLIGRTMCVYAGDRAKMEAALNEVGASGPFVTNMLDVGFVGARGLLTAIAALRWVRSLEGGIPKPSAAGAPVGGGTRAVTTPAQS